MIAFRASLSGCDVLEKSFSVEDLLSRMRGLVRRARAMQGAIVESWLRLGDLVLDEDTFEVERAGELLELTSTEFDLLRFFMRNPGRVHSKPQLQDRVWRYDFSGNPAVVELYVSYLRKKVDTGRSPMFRTVRSAGYMLKAADRWSPVCPPLRSGCAGRRRSVLVASDHFERTDGSPRRPQAGPRETDHSSRRVRP